MYMATIKKENTINIILSVLKQINAKCGLDLYRIPIPEYLSKSSTMLVGLNIKLDSQTKKHILGMVSTSKQYLTKHFSQAQYIPMSEDSEFEIQEHVTQFM